MPLFALYCIDRPNAQEQRASLRDLHIAHVRTPGVTKLAGPMLDEAGKIAGSLLVVEAENLAAAEAFSAQDPYSRAGVYDRVEIHNYNLLYITL